MNYTESSQENDKGSKLRTQPSITRNSDSRNYHQTVIFGSSDMHDARIAGGGE